MYFDIALPFRIGFTSENKRNVHILNFGFKNIQIPFSVELQMGFLLCSFHFLCLQKYTEMKFSKHNSRYFRVGCRDTYIGV